MSNVEDRAAPGREHSHNGSDGHGHSHGLVDPSLVRSREGVKAVSISLAVLLATTLIQIGVFLTTNSVALLADLIHNFGDALTELGDPLIGLAITLVILRITWESWRTIRAS